MRKMCVTNYFDRLNYAILLHRLVTSGLCREIVEFFKTNPSDRSPKLHYG